MVECQLPKLDVAGSSPVSRSIKSRAYRHFWRSKAIVIEAERGLVPEVIGPTTKNDTGPANDAGKAIAPLAVSGAKSVQS